MPTDFRDDDISAIAFRGDSEASAVVPAPQGSINADSLFGHTFEQSETCLNMDVDAFIDFQSHSHRNIMALASVDDLNRNASCSFLDRRTHMVSLDDEASCIVVQHEACAVVAAPEEEFDLDTSLLSLPFDADVVIPWDYCNEKQSVMVQGAEALPTDDHDFSMASFRW